MWEKEFCFNFNYKLEELKLVAENYKVVAMKKKHGVCPVLNKKAMTMVIVSCTYSNAP